MKRLTLLLIICTLISSCGLFRKKTTIKNSALIEQKSDVKESEKENANLNVKQSQSVISFTDDKSKVTTTVKGREIEVTSTGIKCKDCEVNQSKENEIKKQIDSATFINSNLEYAKEADKSVKESFIDEKKVSNVVNEPKGSSFIWLSLAGLIFVIGIIWYLKKK